jgi:hypothetical protein
MWESEGQIAVGLMSLADDETFGANVVIELRLEIWLPINWGLYT